MHYLGAALLLTHFALTHRDTSEVGAAQQSDALSAEQLGGCAAADNQQRVAPVPARNKSGR